jgi:hypothetical protein
MLLTRDLFCKQVFQANGPHKQAGAATFKPHKVDFRLKSIKKDNESHFILMKVTIHKEEKSTFNIHAQHTVALSYTKKTLMTLTTLIDTNTVILGDVNTPLSPIDRSSRQKTSKETSELCQTLYQIDTVDV